MSSARVVRCRVKSFNERNPHQMLNYSSETAVFKAEEEGDDVKSAWSSDALGHTRATMASNNGSLSRKTELIHLNLASVQIEGCNSPS